MKKTKANNKRPTQSQLSGDERIIYRANLRRKKNKRKKMMFFSVLCSFVLLIGVLVVLLMFFNINQITVTGDDVYSDAEVITASQIEIGDNLIFLSKKKINEKITTQLAYVGSVKIKRKLPSTLEITVTKTEAVFAITENGTYTLLDKNGKVLEKGTESVGENIIFLNLGTVTTSQTGQIIITEDAKKLEKAVQIYSYCCDFGLGDITTMNLDDLYNIKVIYQGRIILELGEVTDGNIEKKIRFGKEIIDTQNDEYPNFRGTINLTVDGQGSLSEETQTTEPIPTETVTNTSGQTDVSSNTNATETSTEGASNSTSAAA